MGSIVWLASYPKSGNTWLRAFLANLLADADAPVPFDDYWRYASNEPSGHWYAPHLGGTIGQDDLMRVVQLRPQVQRQIAASAADSVLVKTHSRLGAVFGTPQINMEVTAGAIYLVRNPLDVAVSFADHLGDTIDRAIEVMAKPAMRSAMRVDRVFEWTSDWSGHVESWTANADPALLALRYEDMLADPLGAFTQVVAHLKIEADAATIERAVRLSSFRALKAQEEDGGFAEKSAEGSAFFRVGRAGQWREALSEGQVRRIVARHRTQMERFGYVPD